MRNYSHNQDGRGNGPWTDFINWVMKKFTELQFYDSDTVKVRQTTRGVTFHAKPPAPSLAGLQWQMPDKELDPTVAVSKNTLVYISPENPLVTTGLTDLVSMVTVKSVSGIWCAVKNVPKENGSSQYNVPQLPYPGATGTPSGSPLAGDIDGTNVFWVQMNGGTGGGGNVVMYDTSGATAYAGGTIAFVASQFILSGITVLPGTYALLSSQSTPASPTGNQIPQIPVPLTGTIYWVPIAAGLEACGTCTGSGSGTVYVNSTGTF